MEFIKTAIKSKSNWAILVAGVAGLLGKYGYEISPALQGQVIELALTAVTVIASVIGIKRHTALKVEVKEAPKKKSK